MGQDIQLVIPMAGSGTRFTSAGYSIAKPLLPIHGMPMFEVVVRNLLDPRVSRIVIVARSEWRLKITLHRLGQQLGVPCELVEVDETTSGAAETVERARDFLDFGAPVVTANSDQYIAAPLTSFYDLLLEDGTDGTILCMGDDDPKWSYVSVSASGEALEVREKEVISAYATVGIYGFSSAGSMLSAFGEMREAGDRVNGELYIAPAYNYLIRRGQSIRVIDVGPVGDVMFGMGIPEDYESFLRSPVSTLAAGR